jgi:hypothetical protein
MVATICGQRYNVPTGKSFKSDFKERNYMTKTEAIKLTKELRGLNISWEDCAKL